MKLAAPVWRSMGAPRGGTSRQRPVFSGPDGAPRAESAYGVRFLFTEREYLAPLCLYDYRHRAYSPTLGRFLQADMLGLREDEFNCVRNGVLFWLDAFGL